MASFAQMAARCARQMNAGAPPHLREHIFEIRMHPCSFRFLHPETAAAVAHHRRGAPGRAPPHAGHWCAMAPRSRLVVALTINKFSHLALESA